MSDQNKVEGCKYCEEWNDEYGCEYGRVEELCYVHKAVLKALHTLIEGCGGLRPSCIGCAFHRFDPIRCHIEELVMEENK